MGSKPMRSILVLSILLLSKLLLSPSVLHAEKIDDLKWSVNFNSITISEALDQLSRLTRIKINTSKPIEDRIQKSYQNQTIDKIIRDMLKNLNYASVWSYREASVDAITLWVFEQSVGEDAAEEILVPRIPDFDDQAVSRNPVRLIEPPPRRAIQTGQPLRNIVQQGSEGETFGKPEDQKASQDENKAQESASTKKEADDALEADEKPDATEADATKESPKEAPEEMENSKDSNESEDTESRTSDSPPE